MANKTVTEQREQVIAMLSALKSYNKTAFKKLDSIENKLNSQFARRLIYSYP